MDRRALFLIPAAWLLQCGCGYVGDPLPPSLGIPKAVNDLTVDQRGDALIVQFKIEPVTTDGVGLRKLNAVDLRIGRAAGTVEQWAGQARPVPNEIHEPGTAKVEIPVRDWVGQRVRVAVRLAGPKDRWSGWSNLVEWRVIQPLARPVEVRAQATAKGVELSWRQPDAPAGTVYRIYRRGPGEPQMLLLEGGAGNPYVDAQALYGKKYEYAVQAVLKGDTGESESELSAPVEITPEDRFAPGVPAGLNAITTAHSIELSWEPNTEPDLKGYRIYRALAGQAPQRVAEVDVPSYSDRQTESGKRYSYTVSAIDQAGNESAPSPPAEAAAP